MLLGGFFFVNFRINCGIHLLQLVNAIIEIYYFIRNNRLIAMSYHIKTINSTVVYKIAVNIAYKTILEGF